jgi:hypothetical protein
MPDSAMPYRALSVALQLEGNMRNATWLQQDDLFDAVHYNNVSIPQRVRLELTQLLCALLIELTEPTSAPSGAPQDSEEARSA